MLGYYNHILILYSLSALAYGTQIVLTKTNARFGDQAEERRRSVASLVPVIAAKLLMFVLALPVVRTVILSPESWDSAHVARAHLCGHVLMIVYLFDMTYRKVNVVIWMHHTASISVALFLVLTTRPDVPHIARIWLAVPMVFVGVGVGLTDLGGDVAVLLYYLAPRNLSSAAAIRLCAQYLMVGRAFQWAVMLVFLVQGHWVQLGLGVWPGVAVFMGLGAAELEEIYAILGMSDKLRMRVLDGKNSEAIKS
ncbi:hypothetical protein B0H10DRAFT_2230103 [Mycena sp. CBHHK59/15]|nr:hypothetical protein B0H10DRAFT_2230103 [Mycena sp. CBHHK59/15]